MRLDVDEKLLKDVKTLFEARYGRSLNYSEVISITNNLTDFIEIVLKFKWRKELYANTDIKLCKK
jgi:hypothetical protein